MDLGLAGKKVAILSASRGLGFAIAKAFAEEGARVALCSHNKEHITQAAKLIPGSIPLFYNLEEEGGGKNYIEEVIRIFGGIDIVVTNTPGPKSGLFSELSLLDWENTFHTLWRSVLESIYAALPHMKQQKWGRILMSTSTAAKQPIPNLTLSNAFRTGLLGLAKTISGEVAADGITVNCLLPGYTKTEHLMELGLSNQQLKETIPAKRFGTPEEYAALAVFMGSIHAGYITGRAIAIDGGLILGI